METTAKGKRQKDRCGPAGPRIVRLELKDRLGNPRWITADLVDCSNIGVGVALTAPLEVGAALPFRGKVGQNGSELKTRVRVAWCLERTNGSFRAGLEFLDNAPDSFEDSPETDDAEPGPEPPDYYEIMQLSPNADSETVHRVYRILAQRCHPDNAQTGEAELFVRLAEAYAVLGNPEKRAGYDARHRETKQLHWKIFDQAGVTSGVEAEKRKRLGILGLLYAKMIHDSEHPTLTIHEFENLLGCPREHLAASLWYLKGKGYIQRGDNGRHTITVQGFEHAEEHGGGKIAEDHVLPEPRCRVTAA